MAYTCRVDAEVGRAVITLSGDVDGKTFIDALHALRDDPDWVPGYARRWDARAVASMTLSMPDVRALFQLLGDEQERIWSVRTAFVASRETDRMLFELFRAKTRWWPVRVFRSMEEAYVWLQEG